VVGYPLPLRVLLLALSLNLAFFGLQLLRSLLIIDHGSDKHSNDYCCDPNNDNSTHNDLLSPRDEQSDDPLCCPQHISGSSEPS
jgi:hypothetical protein